MFFKKQYKLFEQLPMLFFLVKWFILSLLSGSTQKLKHMFFKKQYKLFEQLPMLFFLVKWFILSLLSGSLIGSASPVRQSDRFSFSTLASFS